MKQQTNTTRTVMLLAIVAVTISFSSFRQRDSAHQKAFRDGYAQSDDDTITRRKRDRSKDEFNMAGLEEGMKKLDEQMKELDKQMKTLDLSKMQQELDAELKKVDFDKIGKEVEEAMKKVDWEKIREELKQSTAEMKNVNIQEVKKQMEQVKIQLQKEKMNLHLDSEKIKKQVEDGMAEAKEGMAKAMEQLEGIKAFTDQLEQDGLIDKSKAYKVEVKDGELFLNDTKQAKEINDKYRSFIKKGNFVINNDPDEKKRGSI